MSFPRESVTRIDFYITEDQGLNGRYRVVCRLAEKAYRGGHRVLIYAESHAEATELDELLWTFRAGSFVPHSVQGDTETNDPVVIGHTSDPGGFDDVLINLAPAVPAFFSRFQRVAEVVDGAEERKSTARERFRFYRDRGYMLETHRL